MTYTQEFDKIAKSLSGVAAVAVLVADSAFHQQAAESFVELEAIGNPVLGTGTINKVPKWTATDTLGDSIISDDGATATVAGALKVTGDLDHDGANVGFYATAPIAKQTGVAVTSAGIHAALVNLGLITA